MTVYNRTYVVEEKPTTEPDRYVKVTVSYNDGNMRHNHRGYWLSARLYKKEICGGVAMETTDLFGGGVMFLVETAKRYNEKRLVELGAGVKDRPVYTETLEALREKLAGNIDAVLLA